MAKKQTTPLTKEQIKSLSKVGISGIETVEQGREAMIAFLKKNDISDVNDESFEDLYEMTEAMYEEPEAEDEKPEPKKTAKKKVAEPEAEEEEDDDEEDEEEEVKPKKSAKKEEEKTEPKKTTKKKVEVEEEDEEDEIEEEEEEVKPKKSAKKEEDEKPKKAAVKKDKVTKVSKRLDPLNNEEDAAKYDGLKKVLGDKFEYNFIVNGGVSVKHIGKNNKKVFLSFDSPKTNDKGEIIGAVYLPIVREEDKLIELFGEDFKIKKYWSGNLLMFDIPLKSVVDSIKENRASFDKILQILIKKDDKLGKNREKMESDLKKGNVKKEEVKLVKKK